MWRKIAIPAYISVLPPDTRVTTEVQTRVVDTVKGLTMGGGGLPCAGRLKFFHGLFTLLNNTNGRRFV